ncbi:hypothetical protein PsalN5692_03085 [Piscirickettsia salmonis]|uniref:MNIO family bufferin maturase n=1 Tax=Piscirickettsia salmonis TaxID=1238 RepID=UPI0012B901D8|nr:DUF692 domain-containing protein [Piscirickettsia salmonis]QGP51599.1 hypothetical protein PsalN5692_03085 [Piscirickettsia salmonis]QGP53192.1 hypothetical protein PsalSR1_00598 [Piscirickettsia salmonis]QGP60875.1 hypothetical protein PsalBI1_03497 [Piscirickettsia salmonis]QGP62758.1 hypothetical protein PsalMR5_00597 [Piscirickettsia salmonis]
MSAGALSYLGYGLGLRTEHYHDILANFPKEVEWFEIITENYLVPGGKPFYFLDKICEQYPIVMHGVSLSIGSCDPINLDYLKQLKALACRVGAKWISDHLCWTGIQHKNLHDLMPLPYTEEVLMHVVNRVKVVQDFLDQRILIENPSSYIEFSASTMSEWEFMAELARQADCLILLDINNIYVSAFNHAFDPCVYIDAMPKQAIQQFHLAGHSRYDNYIIDTHDHPVIKEVWDLYQYAVKKLGPVSTMIERDDQIPPLGELLKELMVARKLGNQVLVEGKYYDVVS